ncbi:MAG: hypothetical protein ACKVJU_20985 [Verrucomicrobiales bacterium]
MLTRQSFAKEINGPSVDDAVISAGKRGGGWLDWSAVLNRSLYKTLDWAPLGGEDARFRFLSSRGEAVIFRGDFQKDRVLKLRGLEENGFMGGFGSIIGRNERGKLDYLVGTLEQALERERPTWREFGFGCDVFDILEGEVGLVLEQRFINGEAPTETVIRDYMIANGWESISNIPNSKTE